MNALPTELAIGIGIENSSVEVRSYYAKSIFFLDLKCIAIMCSGMIMQRDAAA